MRRLTAFILGSLLGAGLLALYAKPLTAMVERWAGSPMYSYAFTVPAISLFMLWSRRRELMAHQPRPALYTGAAVIAAALALLLLGRTAAIQVVEQLSFLVALAAVVLSLFGAAHFRICAPALAYLLFMVPLWDAFTEPLHWPFQNNSAALGVALLHASGIPAYREGTVIALSSTTIEVSRQCSGVNYLVAVLALALPLAWLRLQTWARRLLLVGAAVAVAALANGLRVALIGALAYWNIGSPLHGPFHVLHGLFVAGIGYVVLFAGLRILESSPAPVINLRSDDSRGQAVPAKTIWAASCLTTVFWAAAALSAHSLTAPAALAVPLDRLPSQLGTWTSTALFFTAADVPQGWTRADNQLLRHYQRSDGRVVAVGIWYFESQQQNREIINSDVETLHRDAEMLALPLANGATLPANLFQSEDEIGMFWYEFDGVPEASRQAAKLRSLWIAVTTRRSNGAAVMLRARQDDRSEGDTLSALQDLAARVHGALAGHWPNPAAARTLTVADTRH